MRARITFFALLFLWTSVLTGQSVFFNEIDYLSDDNCVEIVSAPDQDLTNWSVTTYDNNGFIQSTVPLTGVPPSSTTPTGYNIIEVDIVFLQPNTGGLILVDDNNEVVQFISYNGALMAVDGPAAGATAEDIGMLTTPGNSLQLQGIGTSYPDFDWEVIDEGSCGLVNPDQEFVPIGNPLPIELIYFQATYLESENHIRLDWATASEINHDRFVLERSMNGINFEDVATFSNGQMQTMETTDYTYQDHAILSAQYYYRLRQIDLNSTISFSAIILVEIPGFAAKQPFVFPNPIDNHFNISIPDPTESVLFTLYNQQGQLIQQNILENNENLISIELSDLPAGIYHLHLRQGNQNYYYPLIKR